jgi:cytochrome c-type biogenesis protein CcmE
MTTATPTPTRPRGIAKYLIGLAVIVGAVIYIFTSSINQNLTFFITPSEYLKDETKYAGRTVRLGGVVEPGSVKFNRQTLDLMFVVSDGTAKFLVRHQGTPPDLFREGMGVTIEGKFVGSGTSATFDGTQLLVKHSEEYSAPKPGDPNYNYRKAIEDAR